MTVSRIAVAVGSTTLGLLFAGDAAIGLLSELIARRRSPDAVGGLTLADWIIFGFYSVWAIAGAAFIFLGFYAFASRKSAA